MNYVHYSYEKLCYHLWSRMSNMSCSDWSSIGIDSSCYRSIAHINNNSAVGSIFFFLGGEAEVYCHREGPKGAILKIQASRWCKKRSYGLGKKEDRKIFIHAVPASTAVNNIQDAARWMEDNPRGLQISEIRRKRYAPFEAVYTCHPMVTWVNEILYPRLR